MKIFLDTANLESIEQWSFLIDGVTTNPTTLSKEHKDPTKQVLEICKVLNHKIVNVEVTEKDPNDVYHQAKAIASLHDSIVVKIPCHKDYYWVIQKLVKEKIKINITLVFTLVQALYMCKLGVYYISPFVGRWDDIDVEGSQLLFDIRNMIDSYSYTTTQILAASLRHVRHVHEAIMAGADVATMPLEVLEKTTQHLLTDKGIEQFDNDWKKLRVKEFPSL